MERVIRYRSEIERDLEDANNIMPEDPEGSLSWKAALTVELLLDIRSELMEIKRRMN